MELRLITDQGGDFESYFATVRFNQTWCGRIERQKRLLMYLQTQVPGPSQWVGVSHLLSLSFSDVDSWHPGYRRVKISARRSDSYEISFDSLGQPVTICARDEAAAARVLMEVLQRH